MEKLSAKQTVSSLTEAEAIKQAQEGDAAAFITDNLTSEQILSEDYFRFADYSDTIGSGICGPCRFQSRFNHLECFGI
jgi:hypothetical protein